MVGQALGSWLLQELHPGPGGPETAGIGHAKTGHGGPIKYNVRGFGVRGKDVGEPAIIPFLHYSVGVVPEERGEGSAEGLRWGRWWWSA